MLSFLLRRSLLVLRSAAPLVRRYAAAHGGAALPSPPALATLETPAHMAEARAWVERFRSAAVPKSLVDFAFSRSSGPGGQNVNKVNTKATLRCAVDAPWIPAWARAGMRTSTHYAASSRSILITSTMYRTQTQNVDDCLKKLHALVVAAASAPLRNEPSEAQRARVRALERAESARRRTEKSRRSQVKAGRSGRAGGAWD